MDNIRVLVVDDSAFMRKLITDILTEHDHIEVIDTARNGQDALQKIKAMTPDVVTLDVEMPVMDGLTALQHIMEHDPIPVVMLSGDDHAQKTVHAMTKGAVDFIKKPSGVISLNLTTIKQDLIDRVIVASAAAPLPESPPVRPIKKTSTSSTYFKQTHAKTVVAIGTSTGGPNALQHILTKLPKTFGHPIVIVQHMPERFTKSLADRLNTLTDIHVKEAVHGEILQAGIAYIAPGDFHMHIREAGLSHAIELSKEPDDTRHRPSVDVLFESIARVRNINTLAIILTGMGKDGSKGIEAIKKNDNKAMILAQSEQSSIVYGMPKAAILTELVDQVVPLQEIADYIINLLGNPRGK